jgi:hypothetical protein
MPPKANWEKCNTINSLQGLNLIHFIDEKSIDDDKKREDNIKGMKN